MVPQKAERSYERWIIGVVGTGLVSLLGFLGVRDRVSIDVSIARLQTILETQNAVLAKHEVELQVLKTNLQSLDQQTRENGRKLDTLLVELRKGRPAR